MMGLMPHSPMISTSTRHPRLSPHREMLEMRAPVDLLRPVKEVQRNRFVRWELRNPTFIVIVQTAFVVVDEDGCRDMHSVAKQKGISTSSFLVYEGNNRRMEAIAI